MHSSEIVAPHSFSGGDAEPPLLLSLEFARADAADDPFAFRFAPQEYLLRTPGGSFERANLGWDASLLADLNALREPGRDPAALQRLGERLRSFLSAMGFAEMEQRILGQLNRQGRVILTFRSAAAELYALPWELLTLKSTGQHLGELPGVMLRYEWPDTRSIPEAASRTASTRILMAWSAAGGAIPAAEHAAALQSSCQSAALPFDRDRDILPHTSCRRLVEVLETASREQRPVAVLHILCHGAAIGSTFGLALDGDQSDGSPAVVDAGRLRQLLAPHAATLRLVVLCACDSGNSGALGNQLGSLSQTLHRAGIAAVISSRFPLSAAGSVRLTAALYEALLSGPESLESALLAARKRLAEDATQLDWASLQLFARATEGADTRPIVFRPYRGLLTFQPEHRRFFFGRTQEIERILQTFSALQKAGKPRFIVVAGASGCGKSSVLMAGAVPRLLAAPGANWRQLTIKPGSAPMAGLDEALRASPGSGSLLIAVDQFEEIFTHAADAAARHEYARRLWKLASDPGSGDTVLVTIRVDYLGRGGEVLLDDQGLRLDQILYDDAHRVFITQLQGEQLRAAIEYPSRLVGLHLEEGLSSRMRNDLGAEPGGMPLLQDTLDLLWQHRQERLLTQRAYDDVGGVTGALQSRADLLIDRFNLAEQRVARRLLVRLVSVGESAAQGTRRRVAVSELRPKDASATTVFDSVLSRLVESRLLVCDGEGTAQTVEVAHEALIRRWERLQKWVKEDLTMLAELQKLTNWVEQWKRYQTLLAGAQLARCEEITEKYAEELPEGAAALLQHSKAQQKKRQRIQLGAIAALSSLLIVSVVAAGLALDQNQKNKRILNNAIDVTELIRSTVGTKLVPIAGAAKVRKELLEQSRTLLDMLLRQSPKHRRAQLERSEILAEQADLLIANGDGYQLEQARKLYEEVLAIQKRQAKERPRDPLVQADLVVTLCGLGDVAAAQGKGAEEQAFYAQALTAAKQLAESNPGEPDWQIMLAHTYQKAGFAAEDQGDLAAAAVAFQQQLGIFRRLVDFAPTDADWQFRLAIAYVAVGEVAKRQAQLPAAQAAIRQSLTLLNKVVEIEPQNSSYTRELIATQLILGSAVLQGGNRGEAERIFQQALTLAKKLAASDPSQNDWQSLLARSYVNVGQLQGDGPQIRSKLIAAIQIYSKLVVADPSNTEAQADLAETYRWLGALAQAEEKLTEAQDFFEKALALGQKLVTRNPNNADWQRELGVNYQKLGEIEQARNNLVAAQSLYQDGLRVFKRLAAADPGSALRQRDLSSLQLQLAVLSLSRGDRQESRQWARDVDVALTKLASIDPEDASLEAQRLALKRIKKQAGR